MLRGFVVAEALTPIFELVFRHSVFVYPLFATQRNEAG